MTTDHMPLVSHQSRLSANKDDNEMIPEAVLISPGIYFTAGKTPVKPQLGDSHRLKWGFLSLNKVGRIAEHVRKGEGRK